MRRRTLTALGLGVIALPAIVYGGVFYFLLISVFLVGGAWEYVRMYRAVQIEPNEIVTMGCVLVVATARFFFEEAAIPLFVLCVLLAMTVHLIAFERGRDQAGLDFTVTVAGIVYLGWVGSYLLDLRQLPQGAWWWMLVLPIVWGGDTGAYSIGVVYGKHKMTPRLSPKKKLGGILCRVIHLYPCRSVFFIRILIPGTSAPGRHDYTAPGSVPGPSDRRAGTSR